MTSHTTQVVKLGWSVVTLTSNAAFEAIVELEDAEPEPEQGSSIESNHSSVFSNKGDSFQDILDPWTLAALVEASGVDSEEVLLTLTDAQLERTMAETAVESASFKPSTSARQRGARDAGSEGSEADSAQF